MAIARKRKGVCQALTWLVLATTTLDPDQSGAGERDDMAPARAVSACGRHSLEIARGALFVDGRRVHPANRTVDVLARPTCRSDGRAVAWIERGDGETRLLVLTEMEGRTDALPWRLPFVASGDHVFWAARTRVVVGPSLLAPRAVASWTESPR